MTQPSTPKPTEAELGILNVLWTHGPSTVREVQTRLSATKEVGYTTALKLLQIMTDKGLVTRDESRRSHVYQAAYRQEVTQRQLVNDLLNRAFAGSAGKLVLQALSSERASAEELEEIRRLLDELEEGA